MAHAEACAVLLRMPDLTSTTVARPSNGDAPRSARLAVPASDDQAAAGTAAGAPWSTLNWPNHASKAAMIVLSGLLLVAAFQAFKSTRPPANTRLPMRLPAPAAAPAQVATPAPVTPPAAHTATSPPTPWPKAPDARDAQPSGSSARPAADAGASPISPPQLARPAPPARPTVVGRNGNTVSVEPFTPISLGSEPAPRRATAPTLEDRAEMSRPEPRIGQRPTPSDSAPAGAGIARIRGIRAASNHGVRYE